MIRCSARCREACSFSASSSCFSSSTPLATSCCGRAPFPRCSEASCSSPSCRSSDCSSICSCGPHGRSSRGKTAVRSLKSSLCCRKIQKAKPRNQTNRKRKNPKTNPFGFCDGYWNLFVSCVLDLVSFPYVHRHIPPLAESRSSPVRQSESDGASRALRHLHRPELRCAPLEPPAAKHRHAQAQQVVAGRPRLVRRRGPRPRRRACGADQLHLHASVVGRVAAGAPLHGLRAMEAVDNDAL